MQRFTLKLFYAWWFRNVYFYYEWIRLSYHWGFFSLRRSDGNQHNLRNAAYEALMEMIKNSPKVSLKLWNIYYVESFANMYPWLKILLYCIAVYNVLFWFLQDCYAIVQKTTLVVLEKLERVLQMEVRKHTHYL